MEIQYPNLINGKIGSMITNNKRSIQSFIKKQDIVVENALRRRRNNIINKINIMGIHEIDDFALDTWSFDIDKYNDIVDLYTVLSKKHKMLELENKKMNELISTLLIELNQKNRDIQ